VGELWRSPHSSPLEGGTVVSKGATRVESRTPRVTGLAVGPTRIGEGALLPGGRAAPAGSSPLTPLSCLLLYPAERLGNRIGAQRSGALQFNEQTPAGLAAACWVGLRDELELDASRGRIIRVAALRKFPLG